MRLDIPQKKSIVGLGRGLIAHGEKMQAARRGATPRGHYDIAQDQFEKFLIQAGKEIVDAFEAQR